MPAQPSERACLTVALSHLLEQSLLQRQRACIECAALYMRVSPHLQLLWHAPHAIQHYMRSACSSASPASCRQAAARPRRPSLSLSQLPLRHSPRRLRPLSRLLHLSSHPAVLVPLPVQELRQQGHYLLSRQQSRCPRMQCSNRCSSGETDATPPAVWSWRTAGAESWSVPVQAQDPCNVPFLCHAGNSPQ